MHWVDNYNLIILNDDQPTYISANGTYRYIDLTISSNDFSTETAWHVYLDCYHSDHFSIVTEVGNIIPYNERRQRWITNKQTGHSVALL